MTEESLSRLEAQRLLEESRADRSRLHERISTQEAGIARLAGTVESLRQQVPTDARERLVRVEEQLASLHTDWREKRREFVLLRGSAIAALVALVLWCATCWKDQGRVYQQSNRPSPAGLVQ
jgi:hypothetical protein